MQSESVAGSKTRSRDRFFIRLLLSKEGNGNEFIDYHKNLNT